MARLLLSIAWIALLPLALWAQVQGEDDPRYQKLRTEWLLGADDLATLRDMAALANEGNVAAQVTLGMLESAPQTHGYLTERLYPDSRKAVFRKPNGRFGVPWIRVAAPNSPFAALLMPYEGTDFAAHSGALADAGVIRRAIDYALRPVNLGDHLSSMRAMGHPDLLPYTGPVLFSVMRVIERGLRIGNEKETIEAIVALRKSLPAMDSRDQILGVTYDPFNRPAPLAEADDELRTQGTTLLQHPKLAPLAEVVRAACPQDAAYVMGLVFRLRGSLKARLDLTSPLAPLVSTEDWLASDRFKGDLLRACSRRYPFSRIWNSARHAMPRL